MTPLTVPIVDNVQPHNFPFMSLHPELRHMVYREVFSHRGIILRGDLNCVIHGSTRHYWHIYPDKPDDSVTLLQASKQILAEAKPFLRNFTPSHLTLSKRIRTDYASDYAKRLPDCGFPFQHIVRLNLNVKCLGANPICIRKCFGPTGLYEDIGCGNGYTTDCSYSIDDDDSVNLSPFPNLERNPNLVGISNLARIFRLHSALQEIHIFDVLEHHLSHSVVCSCPIAGTESCTCGCCQCTCITHPPLPTAPNASITETEYTLHRALLSRFRAALPATDVFYTTTNPYSNYHALLEPLVHGVHIYLREEILITAPMEQDKSVHKGLWRATYHIAPPDDVESPAKPPTEIAETPQQHRLRRKMEKQEGPTSVLLSPNLQSPLGRDHKFRKSHERYNGIALVDFEAGTKLELVDQSDFDTIFETSSLESHRAAVVEKYGKFWHWD